MDKDTEWCWLYIHKEAFGRTKKALTSTLVLQYYDVKKPVCTQCDASHGGLGAGVLQDGLPGVYASRALTATERNFAQIEKELLAIVFACEKFDQHLYGREKVHVQSDHKPLEVISRKPLVTAPKRLQRMLLRLQRYSVDVTYTRGSEMHIADTLSRAYIPDEPSVHAVALAKMDMTEGLSVSPKRLEELRAATASDCALQKCMKMTMKGWPTQKSDSDLNVSAYYNVRYATRSWFDVSYNVSCRNENADVGVTTKRRANADTGYTTATCGLDTNAQRHTYQETTSVLGRLSVKQITFLR